MKYFKMQQLRRKSSYLPQLSLRVFLSLLLRERIKVRVLSLAGLTLFVLIVISQLAACETANYAPPVTAHMAPMNSKRRDVDPSTSLRTSLAELERGRTLFVHRCIECHTLPAMWKYYLGDWPKIVNDMSHRASLKPQDRDAVIAYILAVRATEQ